MSIKIKYEFTRLNNTCGGLIVLQGATQLVAVYDIAEGLVVVLLPVEVVRGGVLVVGVLEIGLVGDVTGEVGKFKLIR